MAPWNGPNKALVGWWKNDMPSPATPQMAVGRGHNVQMLQSMCRHLANTAETTLAASLPFRSLLVIVVDWRI